ncbi:hypothetical protein LGQ03_14595 [Loktanella sp. TSTF-M6]|uniref:Curlin associated repeat-containing protein n=1 Tax=Loktanella gaetbuli TaxID=2881335 RepID=A0ABS8BXM1_9RHOB|nr:hypothetical protein [Loktanella gaetbuli]MCB5200475.1 hypothetical protein [Loktanella gaetbuli]
MKTLFLATAATIIASGAFAQDAFITQLGDDNAAANIQTSLGGGNLAVVQQVNNVPGGFFGFLGPQGDNTAVQLQRGADNNAFTYQETTRSSNASLILQTEETGNNVASNNMAINVMANGSADDFTAQTLQYGDDNVAINWIEEGGNAVATGSPTLAMPMLALTSIPNPVPGGMATVSGFGSVSVNSN